MTSGPGNVGTIASPSLKSLSGRRPRRTAARPARMPVAGKCFGGSTTAAPRTLHQIVDHAFRSLTRIVTSISRAVRATPAGRPFQSALKIPHGHGGVLARFKWQAMINCATPPSQREGHADGLSAVAH
jgi:hypothetical protein